MKTTSKKTRLFSRQDLTRVKTMEEYQRIANVVQNRRIVYESQNYKQFGQSDDNRGVAPLHLKKLRESMIKYGWLWCFPMVCVLRGKKLFVFDGQHRLTIAEELGIPVFYIIFPFEFNVSETAAAQTPWSTIDHVKNTAKKGSEIHETLFPLIDSFKAQYGKAVPATLFVLASLFGFPCHDGKKCAVFQKRSGNIWDLEWTKSAMDLYGRLASVAPHARSAAYFQCCLGFGLLTDFDPKQLLRNAKRVPHLLLSSTSRKICLGFLEDVYNHHQRRLFSLKNETENALRDQVEKVSKVFYADD